MSDRSTYYICVVCTALYVDTNIVLLYCITTLLYYNYFTI